MLHALLDTWTAPEQTRTELSRSVSHAVSRTSFRRRAGDCDAEIAEVVRDAALDEGETNLASRLTGPHTPDCRQPGIEGHDHLAIAARATSITPPSASP